MNTASSAGKVVIVTGASAGIGQATALALAGVGARVVLAARRRERLDTLKQSIEGAGGQALVVAGDVTDPGAREHLIAASLSAYGRIDGLVNNAGFAQRGPIEMVPIENIRRNFETNLFSLIALTQLVIPEMRRQASGRIINIGSVAGKIARPLFSVYDATKHALEAVSDGLRVELAPFGIQVVLIQPGFILTEFLEVAREIAAPLEADRSSPYGNFMADPGGSYQKIRKYAGRPEDIARVVVRVLTATRPRARYPVPGHARFFLTLRWLLPDSAWDWIMRRQMGLSRQ